MTYLRCMCACGASGADDKHALQTEQRARELQKMNIKVQLVLIGKKGITYFKRRQDKYSIAGTVQAHPCR